MRRVTAIALAAGFLVIMTPEAQAFDPLLSLCLAGIERVTPDSLWRAWSLAPEVVAPLAAVLAAFFAGSRHAPGSPAQRGAFLAGWALLATALISPLCRLSATLVSAHMVQFMLLVTVAPMLIAASRPAAALAAVAPRLPVARDIAALLPRPGLRGAAVAYGAAIWLWHVPAVYTLLLTSGAAHVIGLAALILIAARFWSTVLAGRKDQQPAAALALLLTMVHTGLLGALITFASRPLYPILAPGAADWGLTPIQDQQLAGLIMWVPGGALFMAAALIVLASWLTSSAKNACVAESAAEIPRRASY